MNSSKVLLSKKELTNKDISEYYRSLENAESMMRSAYHGKDVARETETMDRLNAMRLLVIRELEGSLRLSKEVKKDIARTLKDLLLIAELEKASGNTKIDTSGIESFLAKLNSN